MAASSEYDQVLFEDSKVNRLTEAISLFTETCNSKWFVNTPMILFLNKKDLFEEKVKVKSIRSSPEFEDYKGEEHSYEDGVNYFKDKFLEVNTNPNRTIYSHVTCATDTANVRVVFDACKDIILRESLSSGGFLD